MTIEIQRKCSQFIYRISQDDPMLIERRPNTFGARWTWYLHRDSPNEAKRAMLQLDTVDAALAEHFAAMEEEGEE